MHKKSILLIGVGRFGKHIAVKLSELGNDIMAVDKDENKINEIVSYVTNAEIGDSTNKDYLKMLGVGNYDVCIVAIGQDFQSSLETTSLLKELGAKKVVSRAERDGQAKFLLNNGADEIVYPEKQLATWMVIKYSSDHIFDYIELDNSCGIFEVSVPPTWLNKTIEALDIRRKYHVTIIAIKKDGHVSSAVSPDLVLSDSINLLVLGDLPTIQKCFG